MYLSNQTAEITFETFRFSFSK